MLLPLLLLSAWHPGQREGRGGSEGRGKREEGGGGKEGGAKEGKADAERERS